MAVALSNRQMDNNISNYYEENIPSLNLSGILDALNEMPPLPALQPYVDIIEQPAPKEHRFRYHRENRSLGTIHGVNSSAGNKTYPTIKIGNYIGPAQIVASCVTTELPYLPHPHKLMDKSRCSDGYLSISCNVTADSNEFQIKGGVECTKINEVAEALRARQRLNIDPFMTGYPHISDTKPIDMNAVRLCFQVFIRDESGKCRRALPPIVSDIVYDKKALSELHIASCAPQCGTIMGGTLVILLCEKVTTNDIVEFYLMKDDKVIWRETAATSFIHKQVAVGVITPAFNPMNYMDTTKHVTVQVQLRNQLDKSVSNSKEFEYIPVATDVKTKQKNVADILQLYYDGAATGQNLERVNYGNWRTTPQNTPSPQAGPSHNRFAEQMERTPLYTPPSVSEAGSSPMSYYGGQTSPLREVVPNYRPNIPQYEVPRPNFEDISQGLMHNLQESSQSDAMETGGNSSRSLSNLQLSSGDIPMLSSAELKPYKEIGLSNLA